jgi:hypothetical protein
MSELPPDESSTAAAGADPGRRKAAAHEARDGRRRASDLHSRRGGRRARLTAHMAIGWRTLSAPGPACGRWSRCRLAFVPPMTRRSSIGAPNLQATKRWQDESREVRPGRWAKERGGSATRRGVHSKSAHRGFDEPLVAPCLPALHLIQIAARSRDSETPRAFRPFKPPLPAATMPTCEFR